MYPTVQYVLNQFLGILDDPLGIIFNPTGLPAGIPTPWQVGYQEAYDVLYNQFLLQQVPRIVQVLEGIVVPPQTTSMTPADMGITDFGSFEWLAERQYGSQEKFRDLGQLDRLDQREPVDQLRQFVWRNNTFYFIGATTTRELQIEYDSSGVAPLALDTTIGVDSCSNFLSNYAAGVAGLRKGKDEIAARAMMRAVGPKFDYGVAGGELYRLIAPLVRERQHVQAAHKPYTTTRRLARGGRALPYVAAQAGTTGGGAQNVPVQYSSANADPSNTIIGTIDGVNLIFYIPVGLISPPNVYRNGVLMTLGVDVATNNNEIIFLPPQIPQPGDIITATAYPAYQQ